MTWDPIDPLDHTRELIEIQQYVPADSVYRCDDCGVHVASLPHLIEHLERRH